MTEKIMTINTEELYETAEKYITVMCGFDRETKRAQKSKAMAMQVREKVFNGTKMDFLILPFDTECVKEDYFLLGEQKIECSALTNIDADSVCGGYAFMFHAPMPDLSAYPISEVYLADSWQTCFVDAGRDELRRILLEQASKESNQELYITDSLAPGMNGVPSSKVKTFFKVMNADKIDIEVLESGMMNPVKSFVGIFLLIDQEVVMSSMNCSECLSGHKNCQYCKNYAAKFM